MVPSLSANAVFELLLEAEERLQCHTIQLVDQNDLKGPLSLERAEVYESNHCFYKHSLAKVPIRPVLRMQDSLHVYLEVPAQCTHTHTCTRQCRCTHTFARTHTHAWGGVCVASDEGPGCAVPAMPTSSHSKINAPG